MKTKHSNYILAIIIATVAVLNFQALSASTPGKHSNNREIVKRSNIPAVLSENICYPAEAINRELQGTVRVMAVVEPDGSVSGIRIVEDIGGNCAKEVSRAIRKLHFSPLVENGIATRYALIVNVNFKLEK
jgi:TonB family protein